jgi:surface antigen
MFRCLAIVLLAASLWACAATRFEAALSDGDRAHMAAAVQAALESDRTGEGRVWENPQTGRRGTVTPMRTWRDEDGRPCRDYQALFTVSNTARASYASACREPTGIWVEIRSPSRYAAPGYAHYQRPRLHLSFGFGHHFGHHPLGLHHDHHFGLYPWHDDRHWPYY